MDALSAVSKVVRKDDLSVDLLGDEKVGKMAVE